MSRRLKLGLVAALLFLVGTIGMTAWFYYAPHRAVARLLNQTSLKYCLVGTPVRAPATPIGGSSLLSGAGVA